MGNAQRRPRCGAVSQLRQRMSVGGGRHNGIYLTSTRTLARFSGRSVALTISPCKQATRQKDLGTIAAQCPAFERLRTRSPGHERDEDIFAQLVSALRHAEWWRSADRLEAIALAQPHHLDAL